MKKHTKLHQTDDKKSRGKFDKLANLSGPADEIDALCREKLPDGVIAYGLLAGREAEIRQEALIACLSGYLEERPQYRSAKDANNHEAMASEMARCVSNALRICKMRMATKLTQFQKQHVPVDDHNGGSCHHPYDAKAADWPFTIQVEIVLRAADEAVKTGKLSAMNAGLLGMIVSKGMSVEEISQIRKVSPNAIYQQLRRVKKALPELICRFDPTLSSTHNG